MLGLKYVLLFLFFASARAQMEGFVVGGERAKIENHAHSAFLSVKCHTDKGETVAWICGASIVNQRIILTAGHCLYGCSYESYVGISLGHIHKNKGQTYSTYSFVVHQDYNPTSSSNDIGLVKSDSPFLLGKKVSRVALMKKPPYFEPAVIAGWGMVDEIRQRGSEVLKFTSQKVWSRSNCLKVLRYLGRGTFCAAANNPADYAAQGDSGSALIVRGYIQIGIVSYKLPSISRNVVVYTDVGYYYDWIKSHSRQLNCIV